MNQKKIDRINELTAISRQRGLTVAEQEERSALRAEFRQSFVSNLTNQLEQITIVEPDGKKVPVKDLKKN